MTSTPTARPTTARTGWLAGTLIGVVGGFSVLYLGPAGVAVLAVGILAIAVKGPRAPATAGLATGVGLVWTLAFGNASNELSQLAGGASAVLAIGILSTAAVATRSRRRS